MTELFIDGTSAVLPKDFSIAVRRENPMFTKNGEYTYDITLPLDNPVNAKLYSHLGRWNNAAPLPTGRAAVLVADGRTYCNGTEIITGWTDGTVSIQIASGNSELNWLIGAEKKLSEIGMKETPLRMDDYGKFLHIRDTYPEVEYALFPVANPAGKLLNEWVFYGSEKEPAPAPGAVFAPQPYLLPFMEEVIRALGYTMERNCLEDTIFKDLCICHAWDTARWGDMLPGWTAKDFLAQVEQLFEAVFVVDNKNKSVRLLFRGQYLAGAPVAHVRLVEDAYEAETEEEPDIEDMKQCNVRYNLPDSDTWKFACLPENAKQAAKRDVIPADYKGQSDDQFGRVIDWFYAHQSTDTIYTDERNGLQYLFLQKIEEETGSSGRPTYSQIQYVMVDRFSNLEREGATTDVELDLMPATMAEATIRLLDDNGNEKKDENAQKREVWQLPSVEEGTDTEAEAKTLADIIREGEPGEPSAGSIPLAFYTGMSEIGMASRGNPRTYPLPYTDEYLFGRNVSRKDNVLGTVYRKTNSIGATLRLAKLDELIYQSAYDIDYRHAIKATSFDPEAYDPMAVFEIRHRRYICKEMEYTIGPDGRKGPWTGTFYPVALPDAEATGQWVLADGKWRDGGLWRDNGQWNDS